MRAKISDQIEASISVKQAMARDEALLGEIEQIAKVCIKALEADKKILFMGNGGSAADSQHLAAELVSRFDFDRPGLAGFALTTDTSALTAIGNDYGFERLFARQIEAVGQSGDVLFGFSTSGSSPNILAGFDVAQKTGLIRVGMTGNTKAAIVEAVDYCIEIPSSSTPRIQEGHILAGHIVCGLIEQQMFGASS